MSKTTAELKLTLLPDAYLVVTGGTHPDTERGPGDAWDGSEILLAEEIRDDAKGAALPLVFSERAEHELAELRTQAMVSAAALQRIRNCMDVALGTGLLSEAARALLEGAFVVPAISLASRFVEASSERQVERQGARG